MRSLPLLMLSTVLSVSACAAPAVEEQQETPLVGPVVSLMSMTRGEIDPFDSVGVPCERGVTLAETSIDVDTGDCPYALLASPLESALPRGTRVVGQIFHDYLNAPEPAEGHVGIMIGDQVLADLHVPIPSTPQLHLVEVTLARDVLAGEPVVIHVHNHGSNSWRILEIEAQN